MMQRERAAIGFLLLAATLTTGAACAVGQSKNTEQQRPKNDASQKATNGAKPDRGQQVFNQNCARCHDAPQGFSPNISGTIAMHMRVRARLSEADYRALRKFFNP